MYDAATSEEVLAFLVFALGMAHKPEHLQQFAAKNSDIIACLTDDDKQTLRGVYREMKHKLKEAA